jgi:cysteine synthase B
MDRWVKPFGSELRQFCSEASAKSVLECIGNTPLIKINRVGLNSGAVEIYAKMESFNPGGSVKDRPALKIIEDAERSGLLTPEKVLLDSTSGNMGIAYAMISSAKGYQLELVMPANASVERKGIIQAFCGACVRLTDPLEGSDGALKEARRICEGDPEKYFLLDQYNNPSNPQAHYETTGIEIFQQTDGRITHFVCGVGTGGTLMGSGRRLKELNEGIEIIGVEPLEPLHGIEGLKHMETSIVPGVYDEQFLDRKVMVRTEQACRMTEEIALKEGIFVGHSSGAAMAAASELAREIEKGVIVTLFPDRGDRYLSLKR